MRWNIGGTLGSKPFMRFTRLERARIMRGAWTGLRWFHDGLQSLHYDIKPAVVEEQKKKFTHAYQMFSSTSRVTNGWAS